MPTRLAHWLVAGALAGGASAVYAACPLENTILTGVVVSAADGAPVAGASLEAGWNERAAGRMMLVRESSADGAFSLRIAFDTYSARTFAGREVCAARLQQLDLAVAANGFRRASRTLQRAQLAEPLRIELQPEP